MASPSNPANPLSSGSPTKRILSQAEKKECAALKAEIENANERRPKDQRITQSLAAKTLGITQGAISNYLNGRLALNREFATRISTLYGIPVSSFSPRLALEITLSDAVAETQLETSATTNEAGLPAGLIATLMSRATPCSPSEVRRARAIIACDRILQSLTAGTLPDSVLEALEAVAALAPGPASAQQGH